MQSLVNYQNVNPSVSTVFNSGCAPSCTVTTCSCTQSSLYWSSTTYQSNPNGAWFVDFSDGFVNAYYKSHSATFALSVAARDGRFGDLSDLRI